MKFRTFFHCTFPCKKPEKYKTIETETKITLLCSVGVAALGLSVNELYSSCKFVLRQYIGGSV